MWLGFAAGVLGSVSGLNPRDAAEVRILRRLRNQVHELTPCLPLVESRAVADELRAWIELRPALLGPR